MTSAPAEDGPRNALCSLVEELQTSAPARCHSHIMEIPYFGRIILGELVVGRHGAYLVGVRADLGCTVSGGLTASCRGGTTIGDN